MNNLTLRRIGAVLAGLLAIFVLSTAVDVVLHVTGVYPPWGQPMSNALAANLGPAWYPIGLIVLSLPWAWIGARWYVLTSHA